MNKLAKRLIVAQGLTMAAAGVALVTVLGGCGESSLAVDLTKNPFYERGEYSAFIISEGSLTTRPYNTCEEGFDFLYVRPEGRSKPGRILPSTPEDRQAYLAACTAKLRKKLNTGE